MKVCVFVLVPPDAPSFSNAVDALMERFNYNREVEPYQTECPCIESRARSEISDQVLARLGTMPEVEARLAHRGLTGEQQKRVDELRRKRGGAWSMTDRLSESEKVEWDELIEIQSRPGTEALRLWHGAEREEREANPPTLRPEADCEECAGSGIITTTDNPDGQFDSQILTYDLEVPRYDPALDSNLRLPCLQTPEESCALEDPPIEVSPGRFLSLRKRYARALEGARRANLPTPPRCQGCLMHGERLRWAQDWKENRESMLPVSWMGECRIWPYAVVTPDGQWHDTQPAYFWEEEADIERTNMEQIEKFEGLLEENASCYVGACYVRL